MSSRIQSVDLAVGTPVMVIAPQLFVKAVDANIDPDLDGADTDLTAGQGNAVVADLNGFRGAIVCVYHSPTPASNPIATIARLKHGDTDNYSEHEFVDDDVNVSFVRTGQAGLGVGGVMLTFLVAAARVKRFLSVEVFIQTGANTYQAATITPIGPKVAKPSNVDRSANLFLTTSGTPSFPSQAP